MNGEANLNSLRKANTKNKSKTVAAANMQVQFKLNFLIYFYFNTTISVAVIECVYLHIIVAWIASFMCKFINAVKGTLLLSM